jgi:hypothetical protein
MSFEDDWKYNPAVRFRKLAERLDDDALRKLSFPSTAVQLLLGGNIWPQAQYLNFIRHTGFFFIDLLDCISFEHPRSALYEAADLMEKRISNFRNMFQQHLTLSSLSLPTKSILPYWGKWYLLDIPESFRIDIVEDPRPYNMVTDKLRDIYHYDCAVNANPQPIEVLVANTGFERNTRTSFSSLPIPILCAEVISKKFFAGS